MRAQRYLVVLCVVVGMFFGCQRNGSVMAALRALNERDLHDFEARLAEAGNVNAPIGELKRTIAHYLVLKDMGDGEGMLDRAVSIFVVKGGNLNAQDIYGRTALHYAVRMNRSQDVRLCLVRNGADPTIRDKTGLTPHQYDSEGDRGLQTKHPINK